MRRKRMSFQRVATVYVSIAAISLNLAAPAPTSFLSAAFRVIGLPAGWIAVFISVDSNLHD